MHDRIVRDDYGMNRRLSDCASSAFWRYRGDGPQVEGGWCVVDPPTGLGPYQVDIGSGIGDSKRIRSRTAKDERGREVAMGRGAIVPVRNKLKVRLDDSNWRGGFRGKFGSTRVLPDKCTRTH